MWRIGAYRYRVFTWRLGRASWNGDCAQIANTPGQLAGRGRKPDRVRTMSPSQLVSIGYEGRTIHELVHELQNLHVEVLVDVRLNPLSRKPGLSKRKLAEHLGAAGIDYLHFKALGNPKHNREPFWEGRVAEGCRFFEGLLGSPESRTALDMIAELAASRTVAVLCFERDHDRCHRQVVTTRVTTLNRNEPASVVYA
jgi:uncharacterized protein (DUF488 family)